MKLAEPYPRLTKINTIPYFKTWTPPSSNALIAANY